MRKLKLLLLTLISGVVGLTFCSAGTISDYISISYSGQVSLSANSTTNAIDLGSAPNKTLCITLSGSLGNNNYVNIGFYGNTTNVASDSQEYRYDQVGKTVCMYANKRYFNINNPKSTTPTISYEAYFLNDLLNTEQNCNLKFIDQNNLVRNYYSSGLFYVYFNTNYNTFTHSPLPGPYILDLSLSNNAILKSDIDANYCESNNLCSSNTGNKVDVWLYRSGQNVLEESIVFTGDKIYLRSSAGATYNYLYNNSHNLVVNFSYDSVSCDTGTILSGYILESSINQSYCVDNGLCPSFPIIDQEYCENNFDLISPSSCPVCSGGVSSWSALYINAIQHPGAGIINIDIPEEIGFDYEYSNDVFDLNVEGYNVDYEKIENVVNVQKYIPTKDDFNKIVSGFGGFGALIVAVLFVVLVFYFVKKLF